MMQRSRFYPFAAVLLLAACATVPDGPSVMALPGTGKGLEQFKADDANCRQFSLQQSGGRSADQNAVDSGVRSAAVGTLLGAAAGAAMGGHEGAGVGAGTGLVVGGLAGTEAAGRSAYGTQQRYDIAYVQCMYEKGHRVPVSGRLTVERSRSGYSPPPPPSPPRPASPPPPPMTATPPGMAGSDRLFVYPRGGQSDAQIAADRRMCSNWASAEIGYDAAKDSPADPRHSDFQRAMAACLEAHGYTVK
jgi:hypothetical protein